MYGRGIFAPPRRGRGPRSGRGPLEYIVKSQTIFFSVCASIARNAASPSVAKISGMLRPSRSTITSSRSMKWQQSSSESLLPMLLLPHPINPVNDIIISLRIMSAEGHRRWSDRTVRCQSVHNSRFLRPGSRLLKISEVYRLPVCEAVR